MRLAEITVILYIQSAIKSLSRQAPSHLSPDLE